MAIGGTVTSVGEDEFLLQDATGEVWVDAYEISPDAVNLAVGEQVTVRIAFGIGQAHLGLS